VQAAFHLGVISDTHGLLRPEALAALRASQHILHAGDVGDPEILEQLRDIAPVTAIRGNIDQAGWGKKLPVTEAVELSGVLIYVLHDLAQLDFKPEIGGFHMVVYGHSHVPRQETRNGVLYLNPGSAGPRRFTLPVSLARVVIEDGKIDAEMVTLNV
jgi:putative phosphoesterase